MRPIITLGLSAVFAFAGAAAHAVPISSGSVGSSFSISWLLEDGATDDNGNVNNTGQDISAEAVFTIDDFVTADDTDPDSTNGDFIDLRIDATNTTAPNDDEIGLWKLGFGTSPDAIAVTFIDDPDGEFVDATLGTFEAFPDSKAIDVTTSTDPGARFNLQAGESDTFLLRIEFDDLTTLTTVDFAPFNAFFQGDPDSYQFGSVSVPVPGTLALVGAGLVLLGWSRRRRR